MPNPIVDLGYRYATNRFPGDGATIDWEINFSGGYLRQEHIRGFSKDPDNNVEVPLDPGRLTLIGPNQIRVSPAIPDGIELVVRRDTPKEGPMLDYTDGAILNEKNLNTTTKQSVFATAEMVDYFADFLDIFRGLSDDVIDGINIALDALDLAQQALLIAQEARAFALEALAAAQAAETAAETALENSAAALVAAEAAQAAAEAAQAAAEAAQAAAEQAALDAAAASVAAADALAAVEAILAASRKMEVALYAYGRMQFDNEELIRYLTVRAWTMDNTLTQAVIQIAPTAALSLSIFKNGTVCGSISFSSGILAGTISIPSPVSFLPGDVLSISTITGDVTAAGLSCTVAGTRA